MVKDIWPSSTSSIDYGELLLLAGGKFYFRADDGVHGQELWKSDGTEAGTILVKDIRPGASGSRPMYSAQLMASGNTIYFTADDGVHGDALWKSDGTEAGTVLFKEMYIPEFGVSLLEVDDIIYFVARGAGLWKSDGTEAGTVFITGGNFFGLTVMGNTLYFAADADGYGYELWKSDGSPEGTVRVKDINPDGSSLPSRSNFALKVMGNMLYFDAEDGTHGRELWQSDGTEAGTVMVKDIWVGDNSSFPDFGAVLKVVGNRLYCIANNGMNGYELWALTANDSIIATDNRYTTNEDTPLIVAALGVLADDINTGESMLSAVLVDDVNHGELILNSNGSFVYTPDDNYNGNDNFTYKATDGDIESNIAIVTITVNPVNDAPVAVVGDNQNVVVNAVVSLNGTSSSDLEGDLPLTYDWTQIGRPQVNFTPNLALTTFAAPTIPTTLTFSLRVTDSLGLASVPAITTITVRDTAIIALIASNNGPTVLGDSISLTATATGSNILYTWDFGDGSNGSGATINHTYTTVGDYTATVTASNGTGAQRTTTLVSVHPKEILFPPQAVNDALATKKATTVSGNVLVNDTDPQVSALFVSNFSQPTHGTTDVANNGEFTYTPDLGFVGADIFTYTISNAHNLTDTATVILVVVEMEAIDGQPTAILTTLGVTTTSVISDRGYNIALHIPATAYSDTLKTQDSLLFVYTPMADLPSTPEGFHSIGLGFKLESYLNDIRLEAPIFTTPMISLKSNILLRL